MFDKLPAVVGAGVCVKSAMQATPSALQSHRAPHLQSVYQPCTFPSIGPSGMAHRRRTRLKISVLAVFSGRLKPPLCSNLLS